jgi:hypothetical protein
VSDLRRFTDDELMAVLGDVGYLFTADELAEARQAVAFAVNRYPTLTANGVTSGEPLEHTLDYDEAFIQVATAIAYLRRCTATKKATLNSYWLKHRAEDWGKAQGFSSYVSNGALIAAAVYLEFPTGGRIDNSLNVLVGVREASLPESSR